PSTDQKAMASALLQQQLAKAAKGEETKAGAVPGYDCPTVLRNRGKLRSQGKRTADCTRPATEAELPTVKNSSLMATVLGRTPAQPPTDGSLSPDGIALATEPLTP